MMKPILSLFGFDEADCLIRPFGQGLINTTWQIETKNKKYILQRINHHIFKSPEDIAFNIRMMADYFNKNYPSYLFVNPCQTIEGTDLAKTETGYFRLFPFVENSHTMDVVTEPAQAYEAAKQFAKFTALLSAFDATDLKMTIPDFHNLSLRFRQFEQALETGNQNKIRQSKNWIDFILQQKNIVEDYEICKTVFKIRCIHHDTKISNVLFDEAGKGLCVIDLDTVMPGYFISDVGDMMRTYLCPVSEEEKDFSKITIRKDYYDALVSGYLSEMGGALSATEKKHFHYAGVFMIYMQAIRFLTDHLNDDVYYGAKYEGHNFIRAGNQITLLQKLMAFNPG